MWWMDVDGFKYPVNNILRRSANPLFADFTYAPWKKTGCPAI